MLMNGYWMMQQRCALCGKMLRFIRYRTAVAIRQCPGKSTSAL
jgi:hypothetical protein